MGTVLRAVSRGNVFINALPCWPSLSVRRPWMRAWVMEWVVLVRPTRVVALFGFILGCLVSNRLGLGPVFVLVSRGLHV